MNNYYEEIYNDPIRFMKRKNTPDDPFKPLKEVITILDGKAQLREIPNKAERVIVTGFDVNWQEQTDSNFTILANNEFQVDYLNGLVSFNSSNEGKSLTFTYLGEGVIYFPSTRIYLLDDEFGVLSRKLNDLDRLDLEQKNRVDTLIRENPQPDEIVDVRTDRNGKVYPVARDRINADQKRLKTHILERMVIHIHL